VSVTTSNTTCQGLEATTVIPVEETDATYGRVGMQGKPWVVAIDPADADRVMQVRAKSPTFDYVVGVGGAMDPARRAVVDTTGKCLNCHVGSMYQHGGNRVDNVDLCLLCHNTAANDQYVRVDGFGVDASESYDGRAGQASRRHVPGSRALCAAGQLLPATAGAECQVSPGVRQQDFGRHGLSVSHSLSPGFWPWRFALGSATLLSIKPNPRPLARGLGAGHAVSIIRRVLPRGISQVGDSM
jgi:hypothetical protein